MRRRQIPVVLLLSAAVLSPLMLPDARAADRPQPLPLLSGVSIERLFDVAKQAKAGTAPTGVDRQLLSLAGRDDLIVDQIYASFARPFCDPLTRNGKPIDPLTEITKSREILRPPRHRQ
jgi:hypothetical protein